ncbi:MAG: M56 family metallopeptidase, partial [Rhodobacteraceae bacterium]|nr:M56 family metallopeptidase [Paracoccaceae bacterium]
MSGWLLATLGWTGALIALVLAARGPVSRWFGPQAAYALWLLPFLRLLLPPLVLPAWLAPEASEAEAQTALSIHYETAASPPLAAAPVAEPGFLNAIPWGTLLVGLWLAGAAMFLWQRFDGYFRMRRQLLANARPVGEAGGVRLVESPTVDAPLAFGVVDKVIALPPGFMALHDRTRRDLALAHELAHHRGRDLLANFAIQPLFALHWFNPLGWLGWRAMRRDQEAACDARVVAHGSAGERADYAEVIASFATTTSRPLAAPMACPVMGDKSIIHRLRSLTMSEISPRRRRASRALLAGALVALPLTASITYAEAPIAPVPPVPAVAPPVAPVAPVAPLAADAPPAPPAP